MFFRRISLLGAAVLFWITCSVGNGVAAFILPSSKAWKNGNVGRWNSGHPASARSATSSSFGESVVKTVSKGGTGPSLNRGDVATVKYNCYVANNDGNDNVLFAKAAAQKVMVGDGSMIEGWEQALPSMQVGERATIRVNDPNLAYGAAGVPPVVPPNALVEMDIEVLDAQPPSFNLDFDSLATADDTPRTAEAIAAAYEARQAQKALQDAASPPKEGLEAWLEKARSFYFFGLFEGETGQQAPWFLRPSITFPLAFLVVGAAFYISFVGGAITERGAQVTDELDEIVLSWSHVPAPLAVVACALALLVQ